MRCSRFAAARPSCATASSSAKSTSEQTTEGAVVAMMVGRELAVAHHRSSATAETVLSVDKLTSGTKVVDASFELRRGEVLGVAGLIGAGRTELLRLIAGADRPTSGSITLNGKPLTRHGARAAIAAGIGLVPEERKRDGIIPQRSVVNNVALPSMKRFAPRGLIQRRALRKEATEILTGRQSAAASDRPADPPVQRRQPAEGDHRPLDRGRNRKSCCSTSRRAASTSERRRRSTA